MGLNAFGLLCDILGFSSLSLGLWFDLKRRKTEHGYEKVQEYMDFVKSNADYYQQKVDKANLEIDKYPENREKKKEYLKNKKENDISLRDSYGGQFGPEDMKENIFLFTDGADFDPDEFDKETESELEEKNEALKELKIKASIYSKQNKDTTNIFNSSKFRLFKLKFKKILIHINEQMLFLKIGTILVILGFTLQFLSVI